MSSITRRTIYRTQSVDGVEIFYREAGSPDAPTILLLHGFPSSSHMFRNLIPALADAFHVVAPDYPGFGHSSAPAPFEYTFDHLADVMGRFVVSLGLSRFSLYVQDYGAPIGFRLATRRPEAVAAVITQNGNAYEEGFTSTWEPLIAFAREWTPETEAGVRQLLTLDSTKWQYTQGVRDQAAISPDSWTMDQYFLQRPGIAEIQLHLFHDYQNNRARYPEWHRYFREYRPPTLVIWGANDPFFGADGARAFQRDLPDAELHLLDTGHFALEEEGALIAEHIRRFLTAHVQ